MSYKSSGFSVIALMLWSDGSTTPSPRIRETTKFRLNIVSPLLINRAISFQGFDNASNLQLISHSYVEISFPLTI